MTSIHTCPSCGSRRIKRVCKDVVRNFKGHTYVVPDVTFYECPACAEKLYDREAMEKLEAFRPSEKRIRV